MNTLRGSEERETHVAVDRLALKYCMHEVAIRKAFKEQQDNLQLKNTASSLKDKKAAMALAKAKEDELSMPVDESVDSLVNAKVEMVTKKLETKFNQQVDSLKGIIKDLQRKVKFEAGQKGNSTGQKPSPQAGERNKRGLSRGRGRGGRKGAGRGRGGGTRQKAREERRAAHQARQAQRHQLANSQQPLALTLMLDGKTRSSRLNAAIIFGRGSKGEETLL